MGYYLHHAIIVTVTSGAWEVSGKPTVQELRDKVAAFGLPTTDIVVGNNGWHTFLVGPDGSKEGRPGSDEGDYARNQIIEVLDDYGCVWSEVQYFDDYGERRITRDFLDPELKDADGEIMDAAEYRVE